MGSWGPRFKAMQWSEGAAETSFVTSGMGHAGGADRPRERRLAARSLEKDAEIVGSSLGHGALHRRLGLDPIEVGERVLVLGWLLLQPLLARAVEREAGQSARLSGARTRLIMKSANVSSFPQIQSPSDLASDSSM